MATIELRNGEHEPCLDSSRRGTEASREMVEEEVMRQIQIRHQKRQAAMASANST